MPRVDSAFCGRSREMADGRDLPAADADIGGVPRRSGAVDDVAVVNDQAVRLHGGGKEEEGEQDHRPYTWGANNEPIGREYFAQETVG